VVAGIGASSIIADPIGPVRDESGQLSTKRRGLESTQATAARMKLHATRHVRYELVVNPTSDLTAK